jgi:two-component system, NtrC family, response regulator HydG
MAIRTTPRILIVEDDVDNRAAMIRVLENAGYKAMGTDNGEKGFDRILKQGVDILISDFQLPRMDGVQLLKRAKTISQDIEIILMTGYGSIQSAVEALKEGAYDFITKPVRKAYLLRAVERAAEKQRLARVNQALQSQLDSNRPRILHADPKMRNIVRLVEQVGPTTATVLITGESGTGKEVIAEAIHAASARRDRPLVKVSCAALPDTLLESELFGYEKGAFTGANARKEGRFELANGGTLFLDEIGEMTPATQVKLLRVLQDGKFERLGGTRTIDADVRIIAATNKELKREIAEHRFREDLFYRLNVVDIKVPSLRDRRDDIPLLAMYFLKVYAAKNEKKIVGFSEGAIHALNSYHWPGNVRELENAIERAVVFTNTTMVPLAVLPQSMSAFAESQPSLTFKIGMTWRELEGQAIEIALAHARGSKRMAARTLGIAIRTIYRHLNSTKVAVHNGSENFKERKSAALPISLGKSLIPEGVPISNVPRD